eukprot:Nk52_evm1s1927 gene=Nk52_evmTU1s1927
MPATLTQGRAGRIRSIAERSRARTTRPPMTGISTIFTMDIAMLPASTGSREPASHSVSTGVSSGASRVEIEVMVTDRAVSPLAR